MKKYTTKYVLEELGHKIPDSELPVGVLVGDSGNEEALYRYPTVIACKGCGVEIVKWKAIPTDRKRLFCSRKCTNRGSYLANRERYEIERDELMALKKR